MLQLYNNFLKTKGVIITFSEFATHHKGMEVERLFDFYSVFDGFENARIDDDLAQSIKHNLLVPYESIAEHLRFDKETNFALYLLAKNNRKRYSINRNIGHFKAQNIIKTLLNQGILSLEKSKEQKPLVVKGQKLKKHSKRYAIQDKVLFKDHFTRFFFRFLKPNETLIKKGEFDKVLELIFSEFEHYQSFCFELLSKELLQKKFALENISSFWHKNIELDLYYKDKECCFIGEAKFKNRKICKNIFHLLQNKAKILDIKPDFYVIVSKSGFSNEFERKKERNLLLFDLNDCKELMN